MNITVKTTEGGLIPVQCQFTVYQRVIISNQSFANRSRLIAMLGDFLDRGNLCGGACDEAFVKC